MTTPYTQSDLSGYQSPTLMLADIARQLAAISERLAVRAGSEEGEELRAVSEALSQQAQEMEKVQARIEQQQRLRRKVLDVLAQRNGSALAIELETATLSLPDELAPVIKALADEGLVEIRPIQGGEMVSLTREGWKAIRH